MATAHGLSISSNMGSSMLSFILIWKCWRHVTLPRPHKRHVVLTHVCMSAKCWECRPDTGKKVVVPTFQTTCQQDTIQDLPTCQLILLDIKKNSKACRKLLSNGMIWYKKVTKMVLYVLIHVYVPFFLKK